MTGAKRRATYQDVIDAPEHRIAEIIDGELFVTRLPGPIHTIVASTISAVVGIPFDLGRTGPGDWIILNRPEIHFRNGIDEDVLVPDIAGWRRERLPSLTDDPYFTLAPDFVCEVISKSTRTIDRMKKMPIYARAGVSLAWLVHPGFRTLEVFKAKGGHWGAAAVHRGDVRVRAEPFEAIELDLALWWRDIPQPDRASEGVFAYEYVSE